MSDKPKFARLDALNVADVLRKLLEPVCIKIEIAGSLRRGKKQVSDIELLYVPKVETGHDLLGEVTQKTDLSEFIVHDLLQRGVIRKRVKSNATTTWGDLNKLAVHNDSGIPVDLFKTTQENWWVALVIRTGSKETNLKLTTGAQKLGRKLHAYGSGVEMPDGRVVVAESERMVFELCDVPYLEPERR